MIHGRLSAEVANRVGHQYRAGMLRDMILASTVVRRPDTPAIAVWRKEGRTRRQNLIAPRILDS